MYRSEIHIIKPTHRLFKYCDEMCFKSKNLYNYANYLTRQEFFNSGKYLFPFTLNKDLKVHETFKALPAKTSQQIIIRLGRDWKSFFKGTKIWGKDKKGFCGQPQPPRYKKKDGRNLVCFDYMQGSWKNNQYYFPNQKELFIKTNITKKEFKLCEIIPCGGCYKISIIYKKEMEPEIKTNNNYLAIDLGVNNLTTLVNNAGLQPVIINGKIMKSVNNYYNKEYAKAQSYAQKQSTKRIRRLASKRNNIMDTQMHRVSRWIINYCITNNISNILVGQTDDWKRGINIGANNNQNFVQIPFNKLIYQIQYKGEEAGINVRVINESYTSKASFIDDDTLPKEFGNYEFGGKRIKRGLYKSKEGILINADVNAAYNILRKGNVEFNYEDCVKGLALTPVRINVA